MFFYSVFFFFFFASCSVNVSYMFFILMRRSTLFAVIVDKPERLRFWLSFHIVVCLLCLQSVKSQQKRAKGSVTFCPRLKLSRASVSWVTIKAREKSAESKHF